MKKVLFGLLAAGCVALLGGCGGDDYYEMPEEDAEYEDYEGYEDADSGEDVDYEDADFGEDVDYEDVDWGEDEDYADYEAEDAGEYEDVDSGEEVDYEQQPAYDIDITQVDVDVTLDSFLGSYRSADGLCTAEVKTCTKEYHEVDLALSRGKDDEGLNYFICWKYYPSFDGENFRLYAVSAPRFDEWFNDDGNLVRGDQTASEESCYFYFSSGKLVWINLSDENQEPIVMERVE